MQISRRNKSERTKQQTGITLNNPFLIPEPFHEHTGRERHQEISDISGELHKAALCLRHRKDTLKMLIQYVQQTMSKTPQQEQAGDQYNGTR